MNNNLSVYVLKVWLTSAVLSPLLMLFIFPNKMDIAVLFVMMLLGSICSAPSALLLYFICNWLVKRTNGWSIKLLLTPVGVLLTFMPFWVLGDFEFRQNDLKFSAPYCFTIIIGIWLYKLKLVTKELPTQVSEEML